MRDYILVGNYLDPDGAPVLATQMPSPDGGHIGGFSLARGWTGRWVKAATDEVTAIFAHGEHGLQWDHGRVRHALMPDQWVVWDGTAFRVVDATAFADTYAPVDLSITESETGQ